MTHLDHFWGHIEDLQRTIIRSVIVVFLGFIICLVFYEPILHFFIDSNLNRTEQGLIKQRVERTQLFNPFPFEKIVKLPANARVLDTAGENNEYRLFPGQSLVYEETIASPLLIMGPIEGLILVFKSCFWLGLAVTAPIWGWIWLQFVLPGFKSHEKAFILPFLFLSLLCLILGCLMAYFINLPIANQYLTLFNSSIGQNAWTLTHYVNYVLFLCLGHAIAAELAFLLLILVHFQFLGPEWLISKRRYMIVAAFVLGALLTPPDVLTQILMAIPLLGVYEIAILYAKFRVKKREIILP